MSWKCMQCECQIDDDVIETLKSRCFHTDAITKVGVANKGVPYCPTASCIESVMIQVPTTETTNESKSWCEKAIDIVRGNREGVYGPPTQNFETIARMWNTYLRVRPELHFDKESGEFTLSIVAVAHLMMLLKMSRLANDRFHEDSHIDLAGYTDCAENCVKKMKEDSNGV